MKGVNKLCSKICKFCSLKYLGINKAHVVHFVANISHVKNQKLLPFVTSLIWSFYAFGFGTVQNILLKFVVRRIIIFMKQKVSNTRNHLQKC